MLTSNVVIWSPLLNFLVPFRLPPPEWSRLQLIRSYVMYSLNIATSAMFWGQMKLIFVMNTGSDKASVDEIQQTLSILSFYSFVTDNNFINSFIIIINCSQVCINKQHCSMRFTYTYSKGHQKAKKPSRVMPLGSSLLANRGGGRVLILVCF